ncbi:MAG: glycosyltransferase [Candidatus Binataceae bacterium]
MARDKYLHEGEHKFFVRGVSYGPFAPNSRGERYPEPECAATDFRAMRELGANLVRVYVPPPEWMFELAAKHEMRLMVGMPWPFHMAFLDSSEMMREIRTTIRDGVTRMRQYGEVIAAYSLGNEVRSDMVRWHGPRAVSRFLQELYDIGKQADPDGLFTYSNYPPAEYLDISFLDVICFNVYLHRESDFRRYLTHLMGTTRERPLILSETGMDTIREGEEHQAQLLSWQAQAAFELGLSGFVVFAFTDEWHTGGAEISDWAFGLVSRERQSKRAFHVLGEVFRGPIPPPLKAAPMASVIVPVHNAEATLSECLASLTRLNYPDYEVIVVDDGSTDGSAAIAQAAGVKLLRLQHSGLSVARNEGIAAAKGRIIAFIDADARAETDWLYHLAEVIRRTGAAAAGGPNFPPAPHSALAAAIAAAPGEPAEVRMGADELAQLCGCNMALNREAPIKAAETAPFDPAFRQAGDDVDLSWRLRERGLKLAYAPGAIVMHERRRTLGAYLRQQGGYGYAEGLLARKYPRHSQEGVYVRGRLAAWFGADAPIYYGAFGRGLFQTVYPDKKSDHSAQWPLTIEWLVLAIILLIAGIFNRFFLVLGILGVIATVTSACLGAATVRASSVRGPRGRAILALLWLLGPVVRSYERARVRMRFTPDLNGAPAAAVRLAGTTQLSDATIDVERAVAVMREALVRRGASVALTDGYQTYDLELEIVPALRVPILLLQRANEVAVGWRLRIELVRLLIPALVIFATILLAGYTVPIAAIVTAILIILAGMIGIIRASKVPRLIAAACADTARVLNSHDVAAKAAAET